MKQRDCKKIVIGAGYGMRNLGDEAICETIIEDIYSIDSTTTITVLVFRKDAFLASHPNFVGNGNIQIRSMDFRKRTLLRPIKLFDLLAGMIAIVFCDVFIWGGGNLIRNKKYWLNIYIKPLLLAQSLNKQIIVWSIGIDKISKPEVIELVNKIRKIAIFSVRDKASKDNFLNMSKHFSMAEIKIVRDPVFHFSKLDKTIHQNTRQKIGFDITFWKADFSDMSEIESFVISFAKILNDLHERIGAKLVYLPSAPTRDLFMYELLLKKLNPGIDLEYPDISTPAQYVDYVSNLNLFIGMRMHSMIMASNVGDLHILGVIYDEKVQALVNEMKLRGSFFSIDDIVNNTELVKKKIIDTLKNPPKQSPVFEDLRKDSMRIVDIIKNI